MSSMPVSSTPRPTPVGNLFQQTASCATRRLLGQPFAGMLALIFKGPFGAGDCLVEDKVIHAQEAGAIGVILWDGFGGLPGQIAPGGNIDQVEIPAVDLSRGRQLRPRRRDQPERARRRTTRKRSA